MISRDDLSQLLKHAHDFPALVGDEKRRAELQLITAITSVAFPTATIRAERHRDINRWNSGILRLVRTSQVVTINPGVPFGEICFGHAAGCTMVFPLVDEAFDKFVTTKAPPIEILTRENIIPRTNRRQRVRSVYIGAIVHVPSLDVGKALAPPGSRVMRAALRHVMRFVPRVFMGDDHLETRHGSNYSLPRFTCLVDRRGISEALVHALGFEFCGEDINGDRKYVLDLADLNNPDKLSRGPEDRGLRIRRAVSYLSKYRR